MHVTLVDVANYGIHTTKIYSQAIQESFLPQNRIRYTVSRH